MVNLAFDEALAEYKGTAEAHVIAQETYRAKHAMLFSRSEAKTADAKKAEADIATSIERLQRDKLEIAKDCAYHRVIFLRGSAGEPNR